MPAPAGPCSSSAVSSSSGRAAAAAAAGGSRSRRPSRVSVLLAAAIAATAVAFAWFNVSLSDGVGDRVYAPATAAAIQPSYKVGIGSLRVDLSHADVSTPTHIKARVGLGELRVIVPHDARSRVDASVKAGELHVLGRNDDGTNASLSVGRGRTADDRREGRGRPPRRGARSVTQISALPFERSDDDRVVAGVCGGLAATLGVDATLVRLAFALLALAGGAGILLYFALWVYAAGRRAWAAEALVVLSALALLIGARPLDCGRPRRRPARRGDRDRRRPRRLAAPAAARCRSQASR